MPREVGQLLDSASTYDVAIVGGGPAGCVLASRLSERTTKRVVLIEAGPDLPPGGEPAEVLDPFALNASSSGRLIWPDLVAEDGPDSGDGAGRVTRPFMQACCVGGGSNINGMAADRGLPDDYENWRATGASGWGWNDVLPYFRKLERDLDFSGSTESAMHGGCGPMPVRRLDRSLWGPFVAAIAGALERRGFPFIEDYNGDFREGFASVPTNCLTDRRVSASMAYLNQAVRQRPNLRILADSMADRLSLEDGRIRGVYVRFRGGISLIRARQVIVSGGALQSPALLMRSGIGPRQHLEDHGINLVREAPGVGENLQNHPSLMLTAYLPRAGAQQPENRWFLQNWLRFSSNYPDCDPNDMHLMAFNRCAWHSLGARAGALVVSVLNSHSKGRVRLAGPGAGTQPKIEFNFLADRRDYERLVKGLRFSLELLMDPAVKRVRHEIFVPNLSLVASLSRRSAWNGLRAAALVQLLDRAPLRQRLLARARLDAARLLADEHALREFVWKRAIMQFHVCGTCRMGRADDVNAVVDEGGRVYGTKGLRVADASIFPSVPRGYTHFIVLMAAEKVADAVKADWERGLPEAVG